MVVIIHHILREEALQVAVLQVEALQVVEKKTVAVETQAHNVVETKWTTIRTVKMMTMTMQVVVTMVVEMETSMTTLFPAQHRLQQYLKTTYQMINLVGGVAEDKEAMNQEVQEHMPISMEKMEAHPHLTLMVLLRWQELQQF